MSVVYRDAEGRAVPRSEAVFDPVGRRMDTCLTTGCHRAPTRFYVLPGVLADGLDGHARHCDRHGEELEAVCARNRVAVEADPEFA